MNSGRNIMEKCSDERCKMDFKKVQFPYRVVGADCHRSEERRVGKECT